MNKNFLSFKVISNEWMDANIHITRLGIVIIKKERLKYIKKPRATVEKKPTTRLTILFYNSGDWPRVCLCKNCICIWATFPSLPCLHELLVRNEMFSLKFNMELLCLYTALRQFMKFGFYFVFSIDFWTETPFMLSIQSVF